jgi:hypothetical protein
MTHHLDPVEDLLPRVLSEHGEDLRRGVETLVRAGRTRLDVPGGHVQAALHRRRLLRPAQLVTRSFRGNREAMTSWTRIGRAEIEEDSDSLLKYLAVALTHSLYDLR